VDFLLKINAMPNKTLKAGNILPPDTFFYTIPLEASSQCLTRDMLGEHHPVLRKKDFMGNHCDYVSYKHGILTTKLFQGDHSEYMLFMHVGLKELHVACSCGMPDEKLCRHAYPGLYDMIWRHSLNFRVYYWPGYDLDEKIQRKFLQTDIHKNQITVEPKLRYGNIFRPNIGFVDDERLAIKEKAATVENSISGNREVIAYCLCYSFGGYYLAHLPVIMPCLGVSGKYHQQLASFLQFSTKRKPVQFAYTAKQQQLNEISLKQHELARNYDQATNAEKHSTLPSVKAALFELWRQAFPLLTDENSVMPITSIGSNF
jgi:hypothetical protein